MWEESVEIKNRQIPCMRRSEWLRLIGYLLTVCLKQERERGMQIDTMLL